MKEQMQHFISATIEPALWQEMTRTYQDAQFGYAVVNNQVYFKHVNALLTELLELNGRREALVSLAATRALRIVELEHEVNNHLQTLANQKALVAELQKRLPAESPS